MAETIDVPMVGKTNRTWLLVGGGAAVALVTYFWWRNRGTTYTEDPVVDVPEEELPASPGGVSSGGGDSDSGVDFINTNAEWSQRVRETLGEFTEQSLINSALGKFFQRQPLSPAEVLVVQGAIAFHGYPPQGEWSIIEQDSQPGPNPPQTGDKPGVPQNLRVTKVTSGVWILNWNAVPGATSYELRSVTGHTGDVIRTTVLPTYTARVKQSGGHLGFQVRSKNANGVSDWARKDVIGGK